MITLDVDLSYLSRYYNISTSSLDEYKNKSITQIMQIEANKGNAKAAEFLVRITSEPEELARLFQLVEPKNRYLILMNMNEEDLMKIMQFLEPEQLLLGLSIFNHDVIIKLMQELSPEVLSKVVLSTMDESKFIKQLPDDYLNEFMSSDKLDKNMFMKALQKVDDEQLQKMMEHYTGQPNYDDKDTIMEKLGSLETDKFMRAMVCFESKGKQQLVLNLVKDTPKLFQEFSPEAMTHPFKTMEKEDILKSLSVLETQEMLPMVEDMPQDLMALIATQIDPQVFAKILCDDFKDVIANCGINMF
ncbi:hypothetical protein II906_08710 [bacterium]|nr:hypothetical protein [bacterium]